MEWVPPRSLVIVPALSVEFLVIVPFDDRNSRTDEKFSENERDVSRRSR